VYLRYYVILCLRSSDASAADVGQWSRDYDDYLFEIAICPTCCHSSVLRRILAGAPAAGAGHTDTHFLEAQCVAADPVGVGTTGAQSTACGYSQSACRHGKTDHRLLMDYYKTNIDYEKTEFNIPTFNMHCWYPHPSPGPYRIPPVITTKTACRP